MGKSPDSLGQMPRLIVKNREIHEAFTHLMRTEDNSRLYAQVIAAVNISDISAEAQCILAPGYRLLRIDQRLGASNDLFEIALINDVDKTVVYYNKVMVSNIVDLNCRPATQNLVWRSPNAQHAVVLRDVAQKVFFNYILNNYDVILSDNQQTGEGKFFWQRQMSTALSLGLHVYYYQMMTANLQPIIDQNALNNLEDEIWSESDEQEYHLALISKVALPAELLICSTVEENSTAEATN